VPARRSSPTSGWASPASCSGRCCQRDGVARASDAPVAHRLPDGNPHLAPRAKRVIFLFMVGGTSQMESFDPKPAITKYAGMSIEQTPYKHVLTNKFTSENVRVVIPDDANGKMRSTLYPLQVGHRQRGQSGLEVSDWWPHVGACIDDIAVVRSMWTTDNNHGAQVQLLHRPATPLRGCSRRSGRGRGTGWGR
jgi:hypothetical protein